MEEELDFLIDDIEENFDITVENEEAEDITAKIENDFLKGDKGDTGEQGIQGEQGEAGPSNTLIIGTVEKGEEAFASITGESPNQILNLVLPKGDKGDQGEQGKEGEKGNTGKDGYTPVKGTDYWTEEDKQEIVDEVMDEGVVIDPNYVHTDNNYTLEEKEKLASLENYDDTEIYEFIDDVVGDIETILTTLDTGSGV